LGTLKETLYAKDRFRLSPETRHFLEKLLMPANKGDLCQGVSSKLKRVKSERENNVKGIPSPTVGLWLSHSFTLLPNWAIMWKISLSVGFAVFLGGLVWQPVDAFGVSIVHLPSVSPAPQKITVDGKLDKWQGVNSYVFNPVIKYSVGQASGNVALAAMLQKQPTARIKTCYDTDALYVECEWTDSVAGTNKTSPGNADH
jgi:hypothetical protein